MNNQQQETAMKTGLVITTPHPRPSRQGVADIHNWAAHCMGVELSFLDCINLCIDPLRGVSLTDIAEYILSAVNEDCPDGHWYQLTDTFDIELETESEDK
jgi:hypothetical protein